MQTTPPPSPDPNAGPDAVPSAAPAASPAASPDAAAAPPAIDPELLKRAFTAFKKRLKLTRLDDESRLGGGRPTTTGRASSVAGIMPPNEFPREVWKELARQKKLKDLGQGFYTLP